MAFGLHARAPCADLRLTAVFLRSTPPQEMTMTTPAIDALHEVHTATNDVLTGYREMSARAQPEVAPVIKRLTALHERHAAQQAAVLLSLRDPARDDTSLQGTLNKAVVVVRDWLSDIDREVLPAVRRGEAALRDDYLKALRVEAASSHDAIGPMLRAQLLDIDSEIGLLPAQ
jgi:hypothetical protein